MEDDEYSVDQINIVDLRKKTFVEALLEIKKRPEMWLDESNISCLSSFINGWIVGRNEKADDSILEEFDRFVVDEFHEGNSTVGWSALIVKHCGENDSLASFYKLFDKYIQTQSA